MADPAHIQDVRAELAHLRARRDLYRAKTYGSRPTRPERMRELERLVTQAEERLAHLEAGGTDPAAGHDD